MKKSALLIAALGLTIGARSVRSQSGWMEVPFSHGPIAAFTSWRNDLWVAAGQGIFRSHPGAVEWSSSDSGRDSGSVQCLAVIGPSLVAATSSGLFRIDEKRHWHPAYPEMKNLRLRELSAGDTFAVAVTNEGSLYRLHVGDSAWTSLPSPIEASSVVSAFVAGNHMAVLLRGSFHVSLDGGGHWWRPILPGNGISVAGGDGWCLAMVRLPSSAPIHPDSAQEKIFHGDDSGSAWIPAGFPFEPRYKDWLMAGGHGAVAASSRTLRITRNMGATWEMTSGGPSLGTLSDYRDFGPAGLVQAGGGYYLAGKAGIWFLADAVSGTALIRERRAELGRKAAYDALGKSMEEARSRRTALFLTGAK